MGRGALLGLVALSVATVLGAAPAAAVGDPATIVFARTVAGGDRLQAVSADGSGLRELARGRRLEDPAWSPDGTRIAVAGSRGLELMDAATGARSALTTNRTDGDPSWSPDATRVAFVRTVGGNQDVHVISIGTGATARLTSARARDQEPAWSPDGTTIAFSSLRAGNWELFLMGADGRGERRITRTAAAEGFPAWSPDTVSLAFWRRTPAGTRVFVLVGGRVRRLTSGPGNDYDPAWSPDGSRLAFVSDRGGRPQVYVAARDASRPVAVTARGGVPSGPAWQPGFR